MVESIQLILLAAYALEEGKAKSFSIKTNYVPDERWQVAFDGIANLAMAQEKSLTYGEDKGDLPKNPRLVEVQLAVETADLPPKAEPIIENIFVPDPNAEYGTRAIPRLYMMAAITVEARHRASVVALIVDQKGTIMSQGMKFPGEGGCGHAEVRAIFGLRGNLPPTGAILSRLKPCTMCAGLIYAVDAKDGLAKYWARDDAAGAADWHKINLDLPNGQALDAKCKDAKFLKLPDGSDFAGAFEKARLTADREAKKPLDTDALFSKWLAAWKPPQGISFVSRNQQDLNKGTLVSGGSAKTVKETVLHIDDLCNRKLASGINPNGNVKGLDRTQIASVKGAFEKYCTAQKQKVTPPLGTIDFISYGKDSNALRGAVQEALKAKAAKYQQAEYGTEEAPAKKRNTKIVFEYLAQYLKGMGCTF